MYLACSVGQIEKSIFIFHDKNAGLVRQPSSTVQLIRQTKSDRAYYRQLCVFNNESSPIFIQLYTYCFRCVYIFVHFIILILPIRQNGIQFWCVLFFFSTTAFRSGSCHIGTSLICFFLLYKSSVCECVCVFFSLLNIVIILKWEWFHSIIIIVVIVILLLLLLLLRFPLPRYQSLGIL